ncbi:MAG: helix-turn-helix domain-containing protein [Armatimonadota bacterium]|nr:helix-turn-helix domain-containing protein [Armatimonadota bacterium]MDW8142666.1 helix-turn-helix domain-containing protein [Armatimonadota bacterium]
MTKYSPIWASFMRNIRKAKGLTLIEMAQRLQCTPQYVYELEKGRLPSDSFVISAAKALEEDSIEWYQIYLMSRAETVNLDPSQVFSSKQNPFNDIPIELRSILSQLIRDRKLYQKAISMLKLLVE